VLFQGKWQQLRCDPMLFCPRPNRRLCCSLEKLSFLLRDVKASSSSEVQSRVCQEISLQSTKVATDISTARHYMKMTTDGNFIEFDPRFLVFEFTYSLMLRKSQVILVNKLTGALANRQSMCHQMIMGAGKDGKSLVTQVVPHALLDFSRGVMREKFAAVVRKPIFTFSFSRGTKITRGTLIEFVY
jgi:hypothetical protein